MPPEPPTRVPPEPPKTAPIEETPKTVETKPAEPTTATEIQKAKLEEAEAGEAGKRPNVRNLADLNKLKENPPLKDKPPAGVEPSDPLWNDYVDYWNDRVKQLENELQKSPGAEPKTRPLAGLADVQ